MGNALHRDIKVGETVIIRKKTLLPEYQNNLKFICNGGFGMMGDSTGGKIFGHYFGENEDSYIRGNMIDVKATEKYQIEQAGILVDDPKKKKTKKAKK